MLDLNKYIDTQHRSLVHRPQPDGSIAGRRPAGDFALYPDTSRMGLIVGWNAGGNTAGVPLVQRN